MYIRIIDLTHLSVVVDNEYSKFFIVYHNIYKHWHYSADIWFTLFFSLSFSAPFSLHTLSECAFLRKKLQV